MDLDQLSYDLRHQAANETSQQRKSEALKRLRVVEAFRDGQSRIENKTRMGSHTIFAGHSTRIETSWFHWMVEDSQVLI